MVLSMIHTTYFIRWTALAVLFLLAFDARLLSAQDAQAESSAKEKLLASPEWKQIDSDFQSWLARQAIYRPADIEQINANLAAQIQAMPASEVQAFIGDWQARLKVLKGGEFQDAQDWLGQNLSVMADGFRRRTLKDAGLNDLANMSAVELEDAFMRIRVNRLSTQQRQATFDQSRQQQVQGAQQTNAAARQAQQQSRPSGERRFATHESPYRPPKFNPPPPPRRQFFVTPGGRVMFTLPY
jgi:hypothetical protein